MRRISSCLSTKSSSRPITPPCQRSMCKVCPMSINLPIGNLQVLVENQSSKVLLHPSVATEKPSASYLGLLALPGVERDECRAVDEAFVRAEKPQRLCVAIKRTSLTEQLR